MTEGHAQLLARAFAGKRVLVTGHTGFKGSWLVLWLETLGAEVHGLALPPEAPEGLFVAAGVEGLCEHRVGDIRDLALLRDVLLRVRPQAIFHLAAQPLVRRSYEQPLETLDVNVMGTAKLLEAVRLEKSRCAFVAVTSDKAYENQEWVYGYRETDPMGGHDLYSMSKGGAELVCAAYRRSFFAPANLGDHGVALATGRAGNVIGGGDWATDRIVPDAMRALGEGRPVVVRNPSAVRPWQHVLEPLQGYLLLAARLMGAGPEDPGTFCEPWNFGPRAADSRPVRELVDALVQAWGSGTWRAEATGPAPHEAALLRLSIDKAVARLDWWPRWDFLTAVKRTTEIYRAQKQGISTTGLRALCLTQIAAFQTSSAEATRSLHI